MKRIAKNFLLFAAALACVSASAYETLGSWDSSPIGISVKGSRQFKNLVGEVTQGISELGPDFEKGRNIQIKRGNTNPFLGWTVLLIQDGKIVAAEIVVTKSLRLRGAQGVVLRLIVVHELLHAIGLGHSDDPHSIMFPVIHGAQGITADDVQGIAFLYGG